MLFNHEARQAVRQAKIVIETPPYIEYAQRTRQLELQLRPYSQSEEEVRSALFNQYLRNTYPNATPVSIALAASAIQQDEIRSLVGGVKAETFGLYIGLGPREILPTATQETARAAVSVVRKYETESFVERVANRIKARIARDRAVRKVIEEDRSASLSSMQDSNLSPEDLVTQARK